MVRELVALNASITGTEKVEDLDDDKLAILLDVRYAITPQPSLLPSNRAQPAGPAHAPEWLSGWVLGRRWRRVVFTRAESVLTATLRTAGATA